MINHYIWLVFNYFVTLVQIGVVHLGLVMAASVLTSEYKDIEHTYRYWTVYFFGWFIYFTCKIFEHVSDKLVAESKAKLKKEKEERAAKQAAEDKAYRDRDDPEFYGD